MCKVKATKIDFTEPPMFLKNDRWHGPPGSILHIDEKSGGLTFCCPQCGELGSPRDGAKWTRDTDNIETMTLRPSIAKSCCGWHGYLVKGYFQLEPPP